MNRQRGFALMTGLISMAVSLTAAPLAAAAGSAPPSGSAPMELHSKAAPSFVGEPPPTAIVLRIWGCRIRAVGDGACTVSVVHKPDWLQVRTRRNGRATLRGRPGWADLGPHLITLAATDAAGVTTLLQVVVTVLQPALPPPVFDPPRGRRLPGLLWVTISCSPADADVWYTTDGSVPTPGNALLCQGPVQVSRCLLLTAVAARPGHAPSPPARAEFTFLPAVETLGLSACGDGEAVLSGMADGRGLPGSAWFEWSAKPGFAAPRRMRAVSLASGTAPVSYAATLGGLPAGVQCAYRAVVRTAQGTAYGAWETFGVEPLDPSALVVNTSEDALPPAPGKLSLRAAIERVAPGGTITFDPLLNGRTITLTTVGEAASILRGEVFTIAGGRWVFGGYQERDYGKSALYARKDLTIDAAALPDGIAVAWGGADHARVLAVYGNLTMRGVTVLHGRSVAEPMDGVPSQPFTLARGGGVAVWGRAVLQGCTIAGNEVVGDATASRDRGAFGGGIYGDSLDLSDCVVSGNRASGYGAAGGGIYSVGGAGFAQGTVLDRCAVTGNRVTAQHAYGGGVYSDGGGPGNRMGLGIANSTIARNLVEDNPDIADSPMAQFYYRGGGVYMSNGSMLIAGCTIVENGVTGTPAMFSGKPNMGGGGIAATIGNAHVVESMEIWHSIIAGNRVGGAESDVFTGSLISFNSGGYNLVGSLEFTYILAPVPEWQSLSRRHWPKVGDQEGLALASAVDLGMAGLRHDLVSAGTDAGGPVVLWYPPADFALDRIPAAQYQIPLVVAGYTLLDPGAPDDFLNHVIAKLRADHGAILGDVFGAEFGDLTGVAWGGEAVTWPSDPQNVPWITFWRDLDAAIGDRLGAARLGDAFWGSIDSGPFGNNVLMAVETELLGPIRRADLDQLGRSRYADGEGDIGALERPR